MLARYVFRNKLHGARAVQGYHSHNIKNGGRLQFAQIANHPRGAKLKHSEGHDRYALPTLIFRGPGGDHTVAGWVPYEEYVAGLEAASPGATLDPRPDPTPEQAFERWGMLTAKELAFLCGDQAKAPHDTVSYDWGDGLVYFSKAEAKARGLSLQVSE